MATMLGTSVPGGSSGPASSNKTFHSRCSLSLDATTEPAVPPETSVETIELFRNRNRMKSTKTSAAGKSSRVEQAGKWFDVRLDRGKPATPTSKSNYAARVVCLYTLFAMLWYAERVSPSLTRDACIRVSVCCSCVVKRETETRIPDILSSPSENIPFVRINRKRTFFRYIYICTRCISRLNHF